VKHFDDDRSKHVQKPSSLDKEAVSGAVTPIAVKMFKGAMMERQYVRIVLALAGFPQIARAKVHHSFLASGRQIRTRRAT
jgi:hypothetical protein